MSYLALYRKYRPVTFDEVHGQDAIVQTLRNQVKLNRIGHAYLFCGPRGTGKTSMAKLFAKAINCKNPINGNPCHACLSCKAIQETTNIDIVEIDAASNNGVDNIRELIDASRYVPQYGKYKVYIIDEVHMLSSNAFNALLKTLEEPTPNTVFILATTEYHKVPETIISRCQQFNFKLISINEILYTIKEKLDLEGIKYTDEALLHIAKVSNGGMRDAFSYTDQCIAMSNEITLNVVKDILGEVDFEVIEQIINKIENKDIVNVFDLIENLVCEGKSLSNICLSMYDYYKDLCFKALTNNEDCISIQRNMRILAELSEKMKYNNNRTIFEIEIMKMCKPQMEIDYTSLYQRIQELEDTVEKLASGLSVSFNAKLKINYDEFNDTIYIPMKNIQFQEI